MGKHFLGLTITALAAGALLSGCTDWSKHTNWPKDQKFQDVAVKYDRTYDTGDYDTKDAQPLQAMAEYCSYYFYMQDGKKVWHGTAVWWYAEGVRKAETTYVHGVKQDGKIWYLGGVLREQMKVTDAGRETEYFDRSGSKFGFMKWDRQSKKAIFKLRGKVVEYERFMQEVAKICYGRTRITPHD